MRIRILAISCFLECHNRAQVARQLTVSRRSVNEWVKNYLNSGIDGLKANMISTNAHKSFNIFFIHEYLPIFNSQ
ncbi:helix-turn-helix domain-containing protein [Shewanella livingstonensis]|uniref:Helix-turn-helix domain-containing protein n=1 Tax=Shewanella livingstonensis TaxID=150120 RepID=A0A3G8LSF0_9GAMM|nr:helix-turn-helix domain-containing protein [Shewanella livingstonensis]AZG71668.1 helix-turn-helix domain-containing protein [Shewanella livingstonensis]